MKEYEFDYNICTENNPRIFKEICNTLDEYLDDFLKEDLLIDVDGSTIQIYNKKNTKVIVYDDYDIGAVYVKSDVDLSSAIADILTAA